MILAIDMGNSNIKIGLVENENELIEERIHTDQTQTSMEYAEHILNVLRLYKIDSSEVTGAIISSVVPPITPVLSAAVNKVFGFRPMVVTGNLNMSVTCKGTENPNHVGADLLVEAEAIVHHYSLPCIMVNMGTATTIMLVDGHKDFRGGVILPGMKTALKALSSGTAVLPEISLDEPGNTITLNTVECMRNGIIYGTAAQIDGIVSRMEQELGQKCSLVITGGMSRFCAPFVKHENVHDHMLMMKGLYRLYQENRPS